MVLEPLSSQTRLTQEWEREVELAEVAVEAEQPLVARSHFLRAILQDQTGRARIHYADFLRESRDYSGAAAEYSQVLDLAEELRDEETLLATARNLAKTYEQWGKMPQALYFLDYSILVEARRIVTGELGEEFPQKMGLDLNSFLRPASSHLGSQLLRVFATGDQVQECRLWISLGVLGWLSGDIPEAIEMLRLALREARKLKETKLLGDCFLWLGRVSHSWGQEDLATLSLRRAAWWGASEERANRQWESALRERYSLSSE